jgi:predicted O-methyltransferase YrrM
MTSDDEARAAAAYTVSVCAENRRAAQIDLEQAIIEYRRLGGSMAAIGTAAGYSAAGVLSVLRRHLVA